MSRTNEMEALLIGIDAGCLSVFDRLAEEGRIPNIERLCTGGVCTPLLSQIPPWTPSAWPSLYTGVNPGKHGVTGFVGYDGYDWHVVSADDVEEHALWTLLDRHDMTSVVVNVPVTYPPDSFDGAIIPGFIGPEDPECYPPGTLEEVRREIGEYRVYPRYVRGDDGLTDDEKMAEYGRLVRMRGEAFRYLEETYEPEFGFVQFQKTDTVFHEFDGDEEKVNTVYEAVDDQIGAILDRCAPKRVFLASDHGMGRYDGCEFRVNEFLREAGYVETTNSGKGMPSWNPIRMELREGNTVKKWEPTRTERIAAGVARYGITAHRIGCVLERLRLLDVVKRVVPTNVARTANEQVDFERSRAYMRARTELGIRINLEGREPAGVVPADEYERVRSELIEALKGVTAPDGEPVFEVVAPREQFFDGANVDRVVDVVTIPADFEYFLSEQVGCDQFEQSTVTWDHKMEGVFVASGVGIDGTAELDEAHIFDVAPTVLAALGLPYSTRMDGSVLPIVDDTGAQEYPPYAEAASETSDTDADVERRLADLGYL